MSNKSKKGRKKEGGQGSLSIEDLEKELQKALEQVNFWSQRAWFIRGKIEGKIEGQDLKSKQKKDTMNNKE